MILQYKRQLGVAVLALLPLLIPFIAMQFSSEVNWNFADFVIAGVLLLSAALSIDYVMRNFKKQHRIAIIVTIVIGLMLIWAELAVGIFGTPFAGS